MNKISDHHKKTLSVANNTTAVTNETYTKLLENCFSVLTGSKEPHNINSLLNSKPDLVKNLYAALLSTTVHFVRNKENSASIAEFLSTIGFNTAKINAYVELYGKSADEIEASLINLGNSAPHVTDVTWKIDYIVTSSSLDDGCGPIFRIGLQTEQFDPVKLEKSAEFVNFNCTSQELQDLVYKLKDAVRHCQRIASGEHH